MMKDLILKNRSYRRFDQSVPVPMDTLINLVELARFSPSAMNRQPLKYILSNDPETNEKIFSTLAWAGALKGWAGPEEGERPTAYIIILNDKTLANNPGVDTGIAAQSILLGAVDAGFGGCMLGAVNRPQLCELLKIEDTFSVELVIALGKPVEQIRLVDLETDSYNYWRDENQTHYVPKRKMDDLIVNKHS